ncbi:unnamed protein product [Adineta steineri]|uniref:Uncharacterized protein n=1 Tax=Adineta steineri TaxID=433720 RepID=A0A815SSQ9_9BILA|nr:unnamed protein product [Adineta steineri]CAF1491965.1 unnamed protein product [Adineta steineri]CAF1641741.1 unnamed protein product [Adineta steineri]
MITDGFEPAMKIQYFELIVGFRLSNGNLPLKITRAGVSHYEVPCIDDHELQLDQVTTAPMSKIPLDKFERLHKNTAAIPSTLLTYSMTDFLVDLWLHETPRIHAFIRLYLYSSIPSIHLWLIQIHKRALEICLQQLKTLNNKQNKINLIDFTSCITFLFM